MSNSSFFVVPGGSTINGVKTPEIGMFPFPFDTKRLPIPLSILYFGSIGGFDVAACYGKRRGTTMTFTFTRLLSYFQASACAIAENNFKHSDENRQTQFHLEIYL
jgi:hypothetical protein